MENKKLDKFEQFIKSNLENYKAEYDPKMWDDFQHKNIKSHSQNKSSYLNKILISAVALAIVTVAYNVYFNNNTHTSSRQKEIIVDNKEETPNTEKSEISKLNDTRSENIKSENQTKSDTKSTLSKKSENNKENESNTEKPVSNNTQDYAVAKSSEKTSQIEKLEIRQKKIFLETIADFTEEINEEEINEQNIAIFYKSEACVGEEVKIESQSDTENNKWYIDGTLVAKNSKVLIHTFKEEGQYEIEFQTGKQKLSKKITVFAPAKNKILWKVDDFSNNLVVEFQVESGQELNSYHWDFGDKQYSNEANPRHAYIGNGNYEVELKSIDNNNCKTTIKETVMLNVKNPLLAPTAFTPDGDGLNDFFIPKALEVRNDINFEMFIYDSQGNLVYKTDDKNEPWNGKNNNIGETYKGGNTFLWVVKLNDELGRTGNFMGSVTILNK